MNLNDSYFVLRSHESRRCLKKWKFLPSPIFPSFHQHHRNDKERITCTSVAQRKLLAIAVFQSRRKKWWTLFLSCNFVILVYLSKVLDLYKIFIWRFLSASEALAVRTASIGILVSLVARIWDARWTPWARLRRLLVLPWKTWNVVWN